MTLTAATIAFGLQGPEVQAAAPLPVVALILGRPVAEVAETLPRLFNICRAAQGMAARLSLGLPTDPATGDLLAEIIRDHVLRLCVILPQVFAMAPRPIPADPSALLGTEGAPSDPAALLAADPLAARIAQDFPAGLACCAALPPPPEPLAEGAFENSAAGRQSGHPLLRAIEESHGRGPLWRYGGLLADLAAALAGRLPAPVVTAGVATVPAARGSYALHLTQADDRVTGIRRRTPTDDLLAPGGALVQALAGLPVARRALAPQVIALHDPCIPVSIREAPDA